MCSSQIKKCPRCLEVKDWGAFHMRPNGTPSSYCIPCQDNYSREHYGRNKKAANTNRNRNAKLYRQANRILVNDIKAGRSCMDCGEVHPSWAMEFDHRDPTTKLENVSTIAGRGVSKNPQRLLDEIAKCDLVCVLCHRYRTFGMRRTGVIPSFPSEEHPTGFPELGVSGAHRGVGSSSAVDPRNSRHHRIHSSEG